MSKQPLSTTRSSKVPFFLLTLATFNLRGLGDEVKQSHLNLDAQKYKLDVIALQETKTKDNKLEQKTQIEDNIFLK